jgi:hypothetical protein
MKKMKTTKPKTKLPSKKMADLMDEFLAKYNVSLDTMDSDDLDWICYFLGYRGVDENKSLEFFINDNPQVMDYILDYIVVNAQKDWKSSFQRSLKEFDDLVLEDNADYEEDDQPEVKPISKIKRFWNCFYHGTPNPAVM